MCATCGNVEEMLESLRWHEDMVVTNYAGERVWLKKTDDGRGITDCCPADYPCPWHAELAATGRTHHHTN